MQVIFSRCVQTTTLLVWTLVAAGGSPAVSQIQSPQPAPPFDLPLIDGSGYLNSKDLFPTHEFTFLVFWDSNCPHCVESLLQCETFYEEQTSDDIAIVGLHSDQADPFEVERLIEANRIFFPQLWDIGGGTGRRYTISLATFSLFLVNSGGSIVARRLDPQGDMKEILEDMLSETLPGIPEEQQEVDTGSEEAAPAESKEGFVFGGSQRIRFLSIDSRGIAAVGPYGEELEPGNDLLYRFDFDVSYRITRHLRVGGLLRISNEDEKVLEAGPEYYGSPWGSAFGEIGARGLRLTIGYYRISMTPLTLMRWDWADNPRIGGTAGCGCIAAAGILLVESLEELGPELTFEGGLAAYRRSGFEARAFWAIPRRAIETDYRKFRATGGDRARYSLETYGFEGFWRRGDLRTDSFWKAGVRIVGSRENRRSVDFNRLGYPAPDPWFSSAIASVDWNIPVVRFVNLTGEWIPWNEAEENAEACCDTTLKWKGEGGLAGVVLGNEPRWYLRCDYLYLEPGYHSPFAALSYQPNREGVRLSAQVPLVGDIASASLFYKRLWETETLYENADKEEESFFGASLDLELQNGLGGSLGWLDNGRSRTGSVEPIDDVRRALVADARYHFNRVSSIEIQYQRVERNTTLDNVEYESLANLYSVYLSARF